MPIQLRDYLAADADYIITMTMAHKSYLIANGFPSEKIFTLAEMEGESSDISDPYGLDLDAYKKTAAEINELVQKIRL